METAASGFQRPALVNPPPPRLLPQDVRDDVAGAQDAGMLGILVRTGKKERLTCTRPQTPPECCSFTLFALSPQVNTGKETRLKSPPPLT